MRNLISDAIAQQAFFTMLVQGLTKGLRVLVWILIARWVSVGQFAQFVFGLSIATIGCRIVVLGAPQVLSREWGRSDEPHSQRQKALLQMLHWFFIRGMLLCAIVVLGFTTVHYTFSSDPMANYGGLSVYSMAMIIPLFLVQLIASFFIAQRKVWLGNTFELLFNAVWLGLILLGIHYSQALSSVLLAQFILASVIGLFFYLTYQGGLPLRSQKPNASMMGFVSLQLGGVLFSLVDIVVIRLFSDAHQLAHYTVALQINNLVVFGLTALNQNIFSRLAEDIKRLDRKALQVKLSQYSKIIAGFSILFFMIIICTGYLVLSLYGAAYTSAYLVLVILALGSLFNALSGSTGMILTMSGQEKFAAKVFWFAFACNILMSVCLVYPFGAAGVAVSVALSTVIWNGIMLVKINRTMGLNPTIFNIKTFSLVKAS